MIHWSIIPLEAVMEGYDDPAAQPKLMEVRQGGVTLLVEPLEGGQAKLHRLLSPNASDYLKPEWAPGQLVHLPRDPL